MALAFRTLIRTNGLTQSQDILEHVKAYAEEDVNVLEEVNRYQSDETLFMIVLSFANFGFKICYKSIVN